MDHLHSHVRAHMHRPRKDAAANINANENQMEARQPFAPSRSLQGERTRALAPRDSCTNDTDAGCHKPTQTPTMPIVLAVVIPIVFAVVVLIFLQRRHVKKLRQEDKNDPHKSLDFGMDEAMKSRKKGGKAPPEMIVTDLGSEKEFRKGRGMSLDMDIASPYILPGALNHDGDSIHSMSRSTHDLHDPYRPVTFLKDTGSVRGGKRGDNGSLYTTSSGGTASRMNDGLLRNAQRMSHTNPEDNYSPLDKDIAAIEFPKPAVTPHSPLNPPAPPAILRPGSTGPPRASMISDDLLGIKPMGAPTTSSAPVQRTSSPPVQEAKSPVKSTPSPPPFPRIKSQEAAVVLGNANTQSFMSDSSYGEGFKVTPPSPRSSQPKLANGPAPEVVQPQPKRESYLAGLGVQDTGLNPNRLSMSVRPLPPDDPNEDPEQRANRIRSFYKEYFDDSKPEPAGNSGYNADYYEDYGSEYLDGAVFDPQSGAFVIAQKPFAEPVTRRAMTPPPRAPPRFQSGPRGPGPRGGHMSGGSNASSGRFMPPPRGMSSMSGRMQQPPRKMPPPAALSSLPTPHALKEDSMLVNPADFAPPLSFRDRQIGRRPDSPLGSPRPFSPSVRPHTPLATSFDDLAVMPSPHALRVSGTFTALDFAPPPKFHDPYGSNMSDAGSIRSNRSGVSSRGHMAIRNGAYRVSKIPKGVVGTKDDIMDSLRPKMDMTAPA